MSALTTELLSSSKYIIVSVHQVQVYLFIQQGVSNYITFMYKYCEVISPKREYTHFWLLLILSIFTTTHTP